MHSISLSFLSPGISIFYLFPVLLSHLLSQTTGRGLLGIWGTKLVWFVEFTFYSAADSISGAQFSTQCALPKPRLKFLKYIADETRRFVTFIANRVAIIQEESEPRQWRHVRSEHNPADYASWEIKASETKKLEMWKNKAEFLWKNEDEWPHSLKKLQNHS